MVNIAGIGGLDNEINILGIGKTADEAIKDAISKGNERPSWFCLVTKDAAFCGGGYQTTCKTKNGDVTGLIVSPEEYSTENAHREFARGRHPGDGGPFWKES